MKKHPGGVPERVAAELVEQLLMALQCCHRNGVVHRNVKLDICFFGDETRQRLKVGDFGLAAEVSAGQEGMTEAVGTLSYMAPELLVRPCTYDSSIDIWSLGVNIYIILTGKKPWNSSDSNEKKRMIREDPLVFPEDSEASAELRDLCYQMLKKRAADRCTITEALRHPWIRGPPKDVGVQCEL